MVICLFIWGIFNDQCWIHPRNQMSIHTVVLSVIKQLCGEFWKGSRLRADTKVNQILSYRVFISLRNFCLALQINLQLIWTINKYTVSPVQLSDKQPTSESFLELYRRQPTNNNLSPLSPLARTTLGEPKENLTKALAYILKERYNNNFMYVIKV